MMYDAVVSNTVLLIPRIFEFLPATVAGSDLI